MCKILIRYTPSNQSDRQLWQPYGTYTTISTQSTNTSSTTQTEFKDFETDDIEVLQEEIKKLDKQYGYDNIRAIQDLTYDVSVTVDVKDESDSEVESNDSQESLDT